MSKYFCLSILFVVSVSLHGQRYSEEEIQLQDIYIRANQKKLLMKYDEAIEIYNELLEKAPLNSAIYHDLARIYLAQENFDDAISYAKKAVQFDPDNQWYLMTLAEVNDYAGDYLSSGRALEKLAKITNDEEIFKRWLISYDKAEEFKKAIEIANLAIDRFGQSTYWLDSKLDILIRSNSFSEAEKFLKKNLKENSSQIESYERLANFYFLINKSKKAKSLLEELLQIDPQNEVALQNLALLEKNDLKGDKLDLLSIINDRRLDIDSKVQILLPLINELVNEGPSNKTDPLNIASAEMVKQYPDNAKSHALRGDVLMNSGSHSEAITSYERAIELDKSIYELWSQLMIALSIEKDYDSLLNWSLMAIDFYPNQSEPYYYQSLALFENGQLSEAHEYIDEANFIGSNNPFLSESIVILECRLLESDGQIPDAIALLKNHVNTKKSFAMASELLGDLYLINGNKIEAEKSWNKALELGGNKLRLSQKLQSI